MSQTFGRYELLGELARGGMGAVYRARDPVLGREVALKVITTPLDPVALGRFALEGEAAARIRHPNVLPVHERGVYQGRPYLVMDLAVGSLRDRLRRSGRLPGAEALALLAPIAGALSALHEAQILHRDLKPENILLGTEGQALLADFGVARALDRETRYTETGELLGSPAYMAPEQALGAPLDARVDVYGLGAILYELISGQPPFQGPSLVATLMAVTTSPPEAPSVFAPEVGPELDALCLRCLEKDPAARFQTTAELGAAMRGAAESPGGSGRSGGVKRAGLALLGSLAGIALIALGVVATSLGAQSAGPPTPSSTLRPSAPQTLSVRQVGETARDGSFYLEVVLSRPLPAAGELELSWGSEDVIVLPVPEGQARARYPLRSRRGGIALWSIRLKGTQASAELRVDCPNLPGWYLSLEAPPPLLPGLKPLPEVGDYANRVDSSRMRWIPPGRALVLAVGSERSLAEVSRGFYIGKHEIRAEQLRAYRRWGEGRSELKQVSSRRPAAHVDFHTATRYARWAGGRLPTILEWNLAAFGKGGVRPYPWGDSPPHSTHGLETGAQLPSVVDRLADQTPEGVIGMGGGVTEWVADVNPRRLQGLEPDYSEPSIAVRKRPSTSLECGRWRAVRGGSFLRKLESAAATHPHGPRAALSFRLPKGSAATDVRREQGLRLVRSAWRPEPPHLEWRVEFKTYKNAVFYRDAGGGPRVEDMLPLPYPPSTTRWLHNPWQGVIPRGQLDGFATFARTEVELPAGRWVFSVLNADDGVRVRVRTRGGEELAFAESWQHQVVRHLEAVVELERDTPLVVEVEHFELAGAEGLWVELSRE